jgi:hypothetical protein
MVDTEEVKNHELSSLKLDARGVPLVPQPSDHRDDPLVRRHRIFVVSARNSYPGSLRAELEP